MARIEKARQQWGGAGQPGPGELFDVATLNTAPLELSLGAGYDYPATWTVVGRWSVQISANLLVGQVQSGPIFRNGRTLVFPRVGIVSTAPPAVTRAFTLYVEPFSWVSSGEIIVTVDDGVAYGGNANFTGG